MESFTKEVQKHLSTSYETEIRSTTKNNGIKYTGIKIHLPGRAEEPIVYLNQYKRDFENGRPLNGILEEIERDIEVIKQQRPFVIDKILNFDSIRDKVRIGIINSRWNSDTLDKRVYRSICDLAVVFIVDLSEYIASTNLGAPIIKVQASDLALWDITEEELRKTALENMKRYSNFQITPMGDFLNMIHGVEDGDTVPLYVLHDISGNYPGSAGLVDGDFLQSVAERLEGSYYILPSSIYELIVLPAAKEINAEELNETVKAVNSNVVDREEQLSDHIYLYDAVNKQITMITS